MSLLDFCTEPKNTVARERMLYDKTVHELKLFAANHGHQVQVTEPEIDNLGHDFTLSIEYDTLKVQNKATVWPRGTGSWEIHAAHLMPGFQERDIAPVIDGSPLFWPAGSSGVVLLHEIDREAAADDTLKLRYLYFDIYYAAAVATGLFTSQRFSAPSARDLLLKLWRLPSPSARIDIPRAAFLPISSPAAIIGLRLGLPQPGNYVSIWSGAVTRAPGWKPEPFLADLVEAQIKNWHAGA
jgi:hypothetical protein